MIPNSIFLNKSLSFWALVKSLSETLGYTERATKKVKVFSLEEIYTGIDKLNLNKNTLTKINKNLIDDVVDYIAYRAETINEQVKNNLMNKKSAKILFDNLKKEFNPSCPLPMNKQKGEKKAPAFYTGIINMLLEHNLTGKTIEYDPRQLTTIIKAGVPLSTLSRRIDGAFPSCVNPVAIWEIKEYYYTTTFGSRVADGIYETMLDGLELEKLEKLSGYKVFHYLFVDDYFTWWECGKSYLCRLIDIMHMEYVDEIIFGKEAVEAIPRVTKRWLK
jgi:hypothetical protein